MSWIALEMMFYSKYQLLLKCNKQSKRTQFMEQSRNKNMEYYDRQTKQNRNINQHVQVDSDDGATEKNKTVECGGESEGEEAKGVLKNNIK